MEVKPEIGWRRVCAFFIDVSLILIPALYSTTLIAALFGRPLLLSRAGPDISPFWAIFTVVFIVIYIPFFSGTGKRMLDLTIADNKTGKSPHPRQYMKRSIIKVIALIAAWHYVIPWITITLLSIPMILFVFYVNNTESGALLGEKVFKFISAHFFTGSTLINIFSSIIYSLLVLVTYMLFIRLWRGRGIHDIVGGTKVIRLFSEVLTHKARRVIATLLLLYPLWYFATLEVEKRVSYIKPHPDMLVAAQPLQTYEDRKYGFSIQYDPSKYQPYEKDTIASGYNHIEISHSIVVFENNWRSVVCSPDFSVIFYNNPKKKSVEQYFTDLKYFYSLSSPFEGVREKIIVDKIEGVKVTTGEKPLHRYITYFIPVKDKIYSIHFTQTQLYTPEKFPNEECIANLRTIEHFFTTFRAGK